jgi:hypothetical protein
MKWKEKWKSILNIVPSRIESFAVINLRGVSTNKSIMCFIAMQTYTTEVLILNVLLYSQKTELN